MRKDFVFGVAIDGVTDEVFGYLLPVVGTEVVTVVEKGVYLNFSMTQGTGLRTLNLEVRQIYSGSYCMLKRMERTRVP